MQCTVSRAWGAAALTRELNLDAQSSDISAEEAAYKGLVRPVLKYGSSVWDPNCGSAAREVRCIYCIYM